VGTENSTSVSIGSKLSLDADAPIQGPAVGPSKPELVNEGTNEEGPRPLSPFSANQTMIRNLTMPTVPNFDIPSSPPGSPPLNSSKKFAKFLELKKTGIHFNEKLENSSAIRNPALFKKLLEFSGVGEEDQYVTTLPPELSVRVEYPQWAYPEEMAKRQEIARRKKERIEFAPASSATLAMDSATRPNENITSKLQSDFAQTQTSSSEPQPKRRRFDQR
jgi:hypothetical protein